mmetsp:Transcript_13467/g.38803  ORF Transcript_13467/g.38803 Transcript_13467/m.38803 type:complete len:81 (+) Transcript_13467:1111-1353(+)
MIPSAVTEGPSLPFPPFKQFTVERPIIALPPIPPKNPEITLPKPIARTVRFPSEGVLVKDSTTSEVISDSMQPTVHSKIP